MPENLSASIVPGKPHALLTWEDKTDSENVFRIERSQDGGGSGHLAYLGAATTTGWLSTYTDTTLAGDTS